MKSPTRGIFRLRVAPLIVASLISLASWQAGAQPCTSSTLDELSVLVGLVPASLGALITDDETSNAEITAHLNALSLGQRVAAVRALERAQIVRLYERFESEGVAASDFAPGDGRWRWWGTVDLGGWGRYELERIVDNRRGHNQTALSAATGGGDFTISGSTLDYGEPAGWMARQSFASLTERVVRVADGVLVGKATKDPTALSWYTPSPTAYTIVARVGRENLLANRLVLEDHELILYRDDLELKRYTVGIGSAGMGKQKRGDAKTPRGTYRLLAGRTSSRYLRFLPITYPNAGDAERALASGLITKKQHDAIVRATEAGRLPPQDTPLGGHVGIHGYGQKLDYVPPALQWVHQWADATQGCLIVSDEQIQSLEDEYEPGATLELR